MTYTNTDFKFICFDNLSPLPPNEFYDLHNEFYNNNEFYINIYNFEYRYKLQNIQLMNYYINLQSKNFFSGL